MTSKVRDTKKLQFLKKFEESGNISASCECINIARKTFYAWRDNDPDFADSFEELCESVGDFVEDQLLMQIKAGETAATIFYCKTKLRKRGYVEKFETVNETKITNTKPMDDIDLSNVSSEELQAYIDAKEIADAIEEKCKVKKGN